MGVFYALVIFLNSYRDFAQNFVLIIYSLKWISVPSSWRDVNFGANFHGAM
jgi:hypothetical protein